MTWKPENDGVDHLNIYMRSQTEFGLFFSNLADTPINLPILGNFRTIEGLWYYLGFQDERFRDLSGWETKKLAKDLLVQPSSMPDIAFQYIIRNAIVTKARKYDWEALYKDSYKDLPLTHYFTYGSKNPKVIDVTDKYKWWLDIIDTIRKR